ncbi:hypothetical protein SLA2020_271090 [Shorea laevis]
MMGNVERKVTNIDERTATMEKRQEAMGEHFGGASSSSSSVFMSALVKQVTALNQMMGNVERKVTNIDERTATMEKRQEAMGEHFGGASSSSSSVFMSALMKQVTALIR